MNTLIYQANEKWRFPAALVAAVVIHFAAVSFGTTQEESPAVADFDGEPTIEIVPPDPIADAFQKQSEPLPTPLSPDEFYLENTPTPPLSREQPTKLRPLVKDRTNTAPRSVNLSAAKVLALNAPRPEYPYEARRQKITGDGVALMSVDQGSGSVTAVTMVRSTGNVFLDNAAIAGFRRWRFKPGSVASVTCPVTFTLSGASY